MVIIKKYLTYNFFLKIITQLSEEFENSNFFFFHFQDQNNTYDIFL